jgi:hypothetical protein
MPMRDDEASVAFYTALGPKLTPQLRSSRSSGQTE